MAPCRPPAGSDPQTHDSRSDLSSPQITYKSAVHCYGAEGERSGQIRIDDRVAVVTGAGRGIGAAAAVALAEAGADVVIAARTLEQLRGTASSIEAVGRAAHLIVADLGDVVQIRSLSDAARATFGRLDVVVNNVGGAVPQPFMDIPVEQLEQAFHFNVSTAHALVMSAVPLMLENGGGSVINISSVLALISGRGSCPTAQPRVRSRTTPGSPLRISPRGSG